MLGPSLGVKGKYHGGGGGLNKEIRWKGAVGRFISCVVEVSTGSCPLAANSTSGPP